MSLVAGSPKPFRVRVDHRRGGSVRRALEVVGLCALVLVAGPSFVGSSGASGAGMLSYFAGTGAAGVPTPGPATSSDLDSPFGVAADASGNVYIADQNNSMVLKVDTAGTLSVFAGTGAYGAPTPGPATSSDLGAPVSVAADASGNVYIVDTGSNVAVKVTPGGTLSVFAGTGTNGAPTPGPATSSDLDDPTGVGVDASGNVYIAVQSSNRVVKVDTAGTLSIFAGTGAIGAPIPGPATGSNMAVPWGVAVDGSGNVYVADQYNHVVEKVTPGGTLSIFAGTGTAGVPTPGPATSSSLSIPTGVAVDGSGNVYVVDNYRRMVVKVTPTASAPDAPSGVTGSAGDGAVTVSWNPPASDGGSPITGYTVTAAPGGQTCSTTGATSCVVTGLTNGASYTFTVAATNAEGTSGASAPSATVTPAAPVDIALRFTG